MAKIINCANMCNVDLCDTAAKAEEVRAFRESAGAICYVFKCDRYTTNEIFGAATPTAPTKRVSERLSVSYVVVSPKQPPAITELASPKVN
ncbi:MAG: hypothetical protein SFV19_13755 [Rhodospirillaceae bacterium]|nr:hypothetical protein [Rhodospirillaceae bacterium]